MPEDHSIIPVPTRAITDFPGYRIGIDGSFWSCFVKGGNLRRIGPWKRIIGTRDTNGYFTANIRRESDGKIVKVRFHQLVMLAFGSARPDGCEVCHRDDNPANNSIDNPYWGTHSDNMRDRQRNGRGNFGVSGEDNKQSKLTDDSIRQIRDRYALGASPTLLGREYGVARCTIHGVISRKSWSHI